MIEQLMYFAIGALGMGLFGAFFLPAYRRRAVRLARHHLQLQMPMTMAEVTARLDAVRAEDATAQRAAEQQAERARADLAEQEAKYGHLGNQMLEAQASLAALRADHATTLTALASARAQAVELAATQGAALQAQHDTDGLAADQRRALLDARRERERLEAEGQSDRLTIAALSTRIEGDGLTIMGLRRKLAESVAQLDGAMEVMASLRQTRNEFKVELQKRDEAVQHLQGRHERLLGRHQQIEATLAEARDAGAALERDVESWKVKCRELEASLQRASSSENRRDTRRQAEHRASDAQVARHEQDFQALRSENALLQGRIDTLTRQRPGPQRQIRSDATTAVPASLSAADVAALRLTIRALGDEVAALAAKGPASPGEPASEGQPHDKLVQLQNRLTRSAAAI